MARETQIELTHYKTLLKFMTVKMFINTLRLKKKLSVTYLNVKKLNSILHQYENELKNTGNIISYIFRFLTNKNINNLMIINYFLYIYFIYHSYLLLLLFCYIYSFVYIFFFVQMI
jgi:hypothetical protein